MSLTTRLEQLSEERLALLGYATRVLARAASAPFRLARPTAFLFGFNPWKRAFVRDFLPEYRMVFVPGKGTVERFHEAIRRAPDRVFVVWSYKEPSGTLEYAQAHGIPVIRAEDGFIRSVGLGCMHARPLSMCFDRQGLYFDSRGPSDLEDILAGHDFAADEPLIAKARRCLGLLRELDLSKYNHAGHCDVRAIYGEKTRPRVLVVGQVEDDASIRFGSGHRYTNNDLVWLARLENPDAEIIYKPHPDVLVAKRAALSDPRHVAGIARVVREPLAIGDALRTIDRVYTITSLVGFEALIRGIPVTTLGAPFYSGWGLTDDRQPVARRGRRLTLEEVFAAAYLLYPRYVHPLTGRRIDAEQAIRLLARMKRAAHAAAALAFPGPLVGRERAA